MQRILIIFILYFFTLQNINAQCTLSIRQRGIKTNSDSLLVANHGEIKAQSVNDSTIEFTCNLSEPEKMVIVINWDGKWLTDVWMDPKIKRRELIIDYSQKTAVIKNPTQWDLFLQKIISLEEEGKDTESDSMSDAFMKQHPDSFSSLWLLSTSPLLTENPTKALALFNKLTPALQKYPEYTQIKNSLTKRKYPVIGDSFKEFSLAAINDSVFKSSMIKNKWILLHFWANWCGPCVREMDALVNLYNSLDTSKVAFISVALDYDRNSWKNSATTHKIKWTSVWAENNTYCDLCLNYNVTAFPFFIIFNKEKKIHLITFGDELELVKSALLSIQ